LSSWAERIGIGAEQYDMVIDWLVGRARHFAGVQRRRDGRPFAMTVLFFLASFASLAVLFWPHMIPYSVTVGSAAAPDASLSFLFWGAGLFVLPVIAIHTIAVYWLFRGKMRTGYG
jgi:cytochrome bd ubiquinol oxidase subunit II